MHFLLQLPSRHEGQIKGGGSPSKIGNLKSTYDTTETQSFRTLYSPPVSVCVLNVLMPSLDVTDMLISWSVGISCFCARTAPSAVTRSECTEFFFIKIFEMKESRNERRTRRRGETKADREILRLNQLKKECSDAPKLVFNHWEVVAYKRWLCGYIYNDVRFANGTYIQTSEVTHIEIADYEGTRMWCVKTCRSTYNVRYMSANWIQVGAGNAFNRLKYKLWPKLVVIALLLRARRRVYAPDGPGYIEAMSHFMKLTCNDIVGA